MKAMLLESAAKLQRSECMRDLAAGVQRQFSIPSWQPSDGLKKLTPGSAVR
jgi:hypothetical protein